VVGLDITDEMSAQARPFLDELVVSPAETMPFADATYDAVVCRQGIQFMDLPAAVEEMARVTRPGGRIVLTNLCAYGPDDRAEYFEILRLRNPVRRHFFEQADVEELMRGAGLTDVVSEQHITVEDVDVWSDNGAIDEGRREAIRAVYRAASPEFSSRHAQQLVDGRIVDNMLMVVTSGQVG
jgi:DNA gyrase subunit B